MHSTLDEQDNIHSDAMNPRRSLVTSSDYIPLCICIVSIALSAWEGGVKARIGRWNSPPSV